MLVPTRLRKHNETLAASLHNVVPADDVPRQFPICVTAFTKTNSEIIENCNTWPNVIYGDINIQLEYMGRRPGRDIYIYIYIYTYIYIYI